MCGRCRSTLRAEDIPRACYIDDVPVRTMQMDRYRPSYNVSPGSYLPVVRREDGPEDQGVVVHCMKWGLVPSFTKKTEKPDHYKMFNARSESIFEKPSFRRLVPKNRCLVLAEGFYEWKKDGSKKQPYYIHFKDSRPLVFAALYDAWKNSEGEILYTFTILTTSSSSALQWLHNRMPVILGNKSSTDIWLNGSSSSKFETVLRPYEEPDLACYPVTPAMGKPSFDGPECIKQIDIKAEEEKPITKFFTKKKIDEQESDPLVKSSSQEYSKANQLESLKDEPGTQENAVPSDAHKDYDDLKPDINSEKSTIKRDYKDFSADLSPTDKKKGTSPMKKKGKSKDAGDKQPTLRSYFGKA